MAGGRGQPAPAPSDYTRLDDPLAAFSPDTFFCFFGWNESFAGESGIPKFKADYERFLDDYTKTYPRDDTGSPAAVRPGLAARVRADRRP